MKRQNKKSNVKVIRLIPEKLTAVQGGRNGSVLGGVSVDCAPIEEPTG